MKCHNFTYFNESRNFSSNTTKGKEFIKCSFHKHCFSFHRKTKSHKFAMCILGKHIFVTQMTKGCKRKRLIFRFQCIRCINFNKPCPFFHEEVPIVQTFLPHLYHRNIIYLQTQPIHFLVTFTFFPSHTPRRLFQRFIPHFMPQNGNTN